MVVVVVSVLWHFVFYDTWCVDWISYNLILKNLIRQIWEGCILIYSSCLAEILQKKKEKFLGLINRVVSFCHQFYQISMFGSVSLLWPNRRPLTPEGRWQWGTKWLTLVGGSSPRGWWTSESWTNRPRSSTTSSKTPARSLVDSDSVWCDVDNSQLVKKCSSLLSC